MKYIWLLLVSYVVLRLATLRNLRPSSNTHSPNTQLLVRIINSVRGTEFMLEMSKINNVRRTTTHIALLYYFYWRKTCSLIVLSVAYCNESCDKPIAKLEPIVTVSCMWLFMMNCSFIIVRISDSNVSAWKLNNGICVNLKHSSSSWGWNLQSDVCSTQ